MKRLLLSTVTLLPLAACGSLVDQPVCPDNVTAAVVVSVRDSVTGENITTGSAVVVRDGAFADSVTATTPAAAVGLAYGRPGTYDVTVRRSGYQTWTKPGVQAPQATCGVATATVLSQLVRAP
jgi:hypothetical protein